MVGPLMRIVHYLVKNAPVRIVLILLLQKSDSYILQEQHLSAAVRRVLPRQDPEQ